MHELMYRYNVNHHSEKKNKNIQDNKTQSGKLYSNKLKYESTKFLNESLTN